MAGSSAARRAVRAPCVGTRTRTAPSTSFQVVLPVAAGVNDKCLEHEVDEELPLVPPSADLPDEPVFLLPSSSSLFTSCKCSASWSWRACGVCGCACCRWIPSGLPTLPAGHDRLLSPYWRPCCPQWMMMPPLWVGPSISTSSWFSQVWVDVPLINAGVGANFGKPRLFRQAVAVPLLHPTRHDNEVLSV